jgi:FAD/FMN-containing dehydrogenase
VKGGGATLQPGFSSTKGAMISLTRFRKVDYDSTEQTVRIGVGLKWEEVYSLLEPLGVSVAGGRAPGIGVAGFTLSGGLYSVLPDAVN